MRLELLLYNLKVRLTSQIAGSYLGMLWWFIEPLVTVAAFYIVFEVLLSRGGPGYTSVLLVGITVWSWFNAAIISTTTSLKRGAGIMMQASVSKILFPLTDILDVTVRQVLVAVVLLSILLLLNQVSLNWLFIPLLVFVQFVMILAVGLWVAALVPFFPDLGIMITLGMRMLMFCSGVFYTLDSIAIEYQQYFLLNPIANIINQYRMVVLNNQPPDFYAIGLMFFCSIILSYGAVLFIKKHERKYPRLVSL